MNGPLESNDDFSCRIILLHISGGCSIPLSCPPIFTVLVAGSCCKQVGGIVQFPKHLIIGMLKF